MLLQGFQPESSSGQFFQRRRGIATALSLAAYGGLLGWVFTHKPSEVTHEEIVDVDIRDLPIPEEKAPEEEPEVEEKPPEPPPPPPEPEPSKKVREPEPEPEPFVEEEPAPATPEVPDEMPDAPPSESDSAGNQGSAADYDHAAKHGKPGGTGRPKSARPPAEEKPVVAKPAKKAAPKVDPKVPIEKPEKASNPKPNSANTPPKYPEILRTKSITGSITLKILVYFDGSVRGAKVLKKSNNAANPEDKALADKLFYSAVGKVLPTWKYTPAKLDGQPISVWFTVVVPFKLAQE